MKYLLPGLVSQIENLLACRQFKDQKILVMGSSSESPAIRLADHSNSTVELIVEDYESLLVSKTLLKNENVNIRLMDFSVTDFENDEFDLIYAQASVSGLNKKAIIKEIKRILKPEGIFCVGEITKLQKDTPAFINDITENAELEVYTLEQLRDYYALRQFEIISESEANNSLLDYYQRVRELGTKSIENFDSSEKSYYKKIINQISHESNSFLKFGADKYLGFSSFVLKLNKG